MNTIKELLLDKVKEKGVVDIIMNYKYQIEHYEKYSKSLFLIENMFYIYDNNINQFLLDKYSTYMIESKYITKYYCKICNNLVVSYINDYNNHSNSRFNYRNFHILNNSISTYIYIYTNIDYSNFDLDRIIFNNRIHCYCS